MKKKINEKVIVIGLDGATFDALDPYMKRGELPNLQKMCAEGVRGDLRSSIPPVTGPSWVSFMTGKNPGKHGIYDFVKAGKNEVGRHPVNYKHIRSATILKLVNDAGMKVGMVNMPLTYPPPEVDGFVITGLLTPGNATNISYPEGLFEEVKNKIGGYTMDVWWQYYGERGVEKFLDEIIECTEQRCRAFEYLMENKQWDLFISVFIGSDRIQHYLWKYIHPVDPDSLTTREKGFVKKIKEYYQMVDAFMGKVMERYGDVANILMVSDHGFGPREKKVYVNQWLHQQGYLELNQSKQLSHMAFRQSVLKVKRYLRRIDKHNLRKRILPSRGKGGRIHAYDFLQVINWSKTKAYSASNTEQGFYVNLKGREPDGVISPGQEYEEFRDDLIAALKKMRDPATGEAVVTHTYKKEELYSGPYLDDAPDIIFFLKGGAYLADVQLKGHVFEKASYASGWGTHRMEGILLGYGKDLKKKGAVEGAHIMDIAPTILRLLGVPVPRGMDGQALDGIIKGRFLRSHKAAFSDDEGVVIDSGADSFLSEEDEEEVAKRLKGLGYL